MLTRALGSVGEAVDGSGRHAGKTITAPTQWHLTRATIFAQVPYKIPCVDQMRLAHTGIILSEMCAGSQGRRSFARVRASH